MIKELLKYKKIISILAIGFIVYDLTEMINDFTFISILNELSLIVFFTSIILYLNGKNIIGLVMMYASNLFLIYPLIIDNGRMAYYFRSIGIALICSIIFTYIYRSDKKYMSKHNQLNDQKPS